MSELNSINEKPITDEPIRKFKIGECSVTVLGTAHVSKASVDAVKKFIQEEKPDTVCVELCDSRLASIKDPDKWKKLDIFKVFKERKMYLLLANLILSSFQKKIGPSDVKPGDELRAAVEEAEKLNAKVITADREIQTTLKRSWGNVGFFSKSYLFSALITSLFVREQVTEEKLAEMKQEDILNDLFSNLPAGFSEIKKVIIDERDEYLAEKIKQSAKGSKKLFAVVGAGHLKGITEQIDKDHDLDKLNEVPTPTLWDHLKSFFWPLLFLSLLGVIMARGGKDAGAEFVVTWILVKGGLAAIGALIALAHPLSIVAAFVSAPIGTFIPVLKAGWVAALTELWLRKPKVEDFENIAKDTETVAGFWKNRVVKIFLILILPNLGSTLGTFLVTGKALKGLFN